MANLAFFYNYKLCLLIRLVINFLIFQISTAKYIQYKFENNEKSLKKSLSFINDDNPKNNKNRNNPTYSLKNENLISYLYNFLTSQKTDKSRISYVGTNKLEAEAFSNDTEIIELNPMFSSIYFFVPVQIGSNKFQLGLIIDIYNYYTYILAEKMKNATYNSCYEYEFYNSSLSNSYKKDASSDFRSKIFFRDLNFTGIPSLEDFYLWLNPNTNRVSDFPFYLIEKPEVKYNQLLCISLDGGLGLSFSPNYKLSFLQHLKNQGLIKNRMFAILFPVMENELMLLHLGGYKKDFVNDTALINWVDVAIIQPNQTKAEDNQSSFKTNHPESEFVTLLERNNNNNLSGLLDYIDDTDEEEEEISGNNQIKYMKNNLNKYDDLYQHGNSYTKNNFHSLILINNSAHLQSKNIDNTKKTLIKNASGTEDILNYSNSNKKIKRISNRAESTASTAEDPIYRINWFISPKKVHIRNLTLLNETRVTFNSLSESIVIPKRIFFENFKYLFNQEADCQIAEDGYFYCKCYANNSEVFPTFTFEFNEKFNLTVKPYDYMQIVINFNSNDLRPCKLLMKLNYDDNFWEFGIYVMNNFYLIFDQENNKLGFFERSLINPNDNNQGAFIILIVSVASIMFFTFIYLLFKKCVNRTSSQRADPNQQNILSS